MANTYSQKRKIVSAGEILSPAVEQGLLHPKKHSKGRMISIYLSHVPTYLHCGDLHPNLIDCDVNCAKEGSQAQDFLIPVPADCIKPDTIILGEYDLYLLLKSLRYWIVSTIPESIIRYALNPRTKPSFTRISMAFAKYMPRLSQLENLAEMATSRRGTLLAPAATEASADISLKKPVGMGIPQLLVFSIENNYSEELVAYLFSQCPKVSLLDPSLKVTKVAAKCGSLKWLRYARENHMCPWDAEICKTAAMAGHIDCLRYAHEHDCDWDKDTCRLAALHGHFECLKYAHEQGCAWDKDVCYSASLMGHFDCLKYAHEQGCSWDSEVCSYAALNGHLSCIQYAYQHGLAANPDACSKAAKNNHLNCLDFLHTKGSPWTGAETRLAAIGGHFDCLKFLHENGCSWDSTTTTAAALNGHLSCLQYAHENGCDWSETTCAAAARGGHLDCLQYAHEHGCEWDESACINACHWDNVDCLEYAHKHGCSLGVESYLVAKRGRGIKCLQYILQAAENPSEYNLFEELL